MTLSDALYLAKASRLLTDNSFLQIKNHFVWQCQMKLENSLEKRSFCPHCMHCWFDGKFSYRVMKDVLPGPRMSKILLKHKKSPESLNRVESKLFFRYCRKRGNQIVLHCQICKRDTEIQMKKPVNLKKNIDHSHCELQEVEQYTPLKKKKKKKKDNYVGLKASAVISAASVSLPANETKNKSNQESKHSTWAEAADSSQQKCPKKYKCFSELQHSKQDSIHQNLQKPNTGNQFHGKVTTSSVGEKMRHLREEQKCKTLQAMAASKVKVKKRTKLRNFLSQQDKKSGLEDRIQSFLEL